MRTVTLMKAPTTAGAYAPGQEDGPRALLDAGLRERLEAVGVTVHVGGQASPFRWRPDPRTRGPRTPARSSIAPARSPRWSDQLQPSTRLWFSEEIAPLVSAPSPVTRYARGGAEDALRRLSAGTLGGAVAHVGLFPQGHRSRMAGAGPRSKQQENA